MIRVQGLDFHVRDVGGNRPALVFLHYWGGTGRTWDLVIREVAGRHRCVAPDFRGWGESDKTADSSGMLFEAIQAPVFSQSIGANLLRDAFGRQLLHGDALVAFQPSAAHRLLGEDGNNAIAFQVRLARCLVTGRQFLADGIEVRVPLICIGAGIPRLLQKLLGRERLEIVQSC
jgi:hypothetical protein